MPIDDLVAPMDFSAWWTVTGIALIVAIAAWLVFVFVHTRHRPTEAALPPAPPPAAYAAGGDPFVDLRPSRRACSLMRWRREGESTVPGQMA